MVGSPPRQPRSWTRKDSYRPDYRSEPKSSDFDIGQALDSVVSTLYPEFKVSLQVEKAQQTLNEKRKVLDKTEKTSSHFVPNIEAAKSKVREAEAKLDTNKKLLQDHQSQRVLVVQQAADAFRLAHVPQDSVYELREELRVSRERVGAKDDEISLLNQRLAALERDFDSFKNFNHQAHAQAIELGRDVQRLKAAGASAESKLDDHETAVILLKNNSRTALERTAELSGKQDALAVAQEQLQGDLANKQSGPAQEAAVELCKLQADINQKPSHKTVEEQVAGLRQEINDGLLRNKGPEGIDRVQEQLEAVRSTAEESLQAVRKELLDQIETSDDIHEESFKAASQEMQRVSNSLDELIRNHTRLDADLASHNSNLQRVSESLQRHAVMVEGIRNTVSDHVTELEGHGGIIRFLEDRYNSLTTREVVDAMCNQMRKLYPQYSTAEVQKRLNQLAAHIQNLERQTIEQLRSEVRAFYGQVGQQNFAANDREPLKQLQNTVEEQMETLRHDFVKGEEFSKYRESVTGRHNEVLRTCNQKLSSCTDQQQLLRGEFQTLQDKFSQTDECSSSQQDAINTAVETLSGHVGKINHLSERCDLNEARDKARGDEFQKLRENLDGQIKKLTSRVKGSKGLEGKIAAVGPDFAHLQKSIDDKTESIGHEFGEKLESYRANTLMWTGELKNKIDTNQKQNQSVQKDLQNSQKEYVYVIESLDSLLIHFAASTNV